jgi:hypothetical protein
VGLSKEKKLGLPEMTTHVQLFSSYYTASFFTAVITNVGRTPHSFTKDNKVICKVILL